MSANSLMLADMIGKLMEMQRQLEQKPSPSSKIQANINDLHFRVDNVYRAFAKIEPLAEANSNMVDSKATILSPTESAHKSFTNSIRIKRAKNNPLPWLAQNSNSSTKLTRQATWEANSSHRVKKNFEQSAVQKSLARRAVLAEASTNRSIASRTEDDAKSKAERLALIRHRQRMLRVGEFVDENNKNTAPTAMFSGLSFRPKPPPATEIIKTESPREDQENEGQ